MLQADSAVDISERIRFQAIELFIVHLPSDKSEPFRPFGDHYRVLMGIHAGGGCGWGEIYLHEGQRPADWVVWASWYERFMHRSFDCKASLEKDILYAVDPSHLTRVQLLCDALQTLHSSRENASELTNQGTNGGLFRMAEAYVSLF
ncbi:hypothetical protein ACTHPF_12745 [Paenibacillus sp. SAF-054]|uniref:hypothetical protein n=1 Tax=unclassified Paenibacillus TaxID=185978 RepID=UPI003F800143